LKPQTCIALLTAAVFAACTPQPPERRMGSDAATALGGAEKLQAV